MSDILRLLVFLLDPEDKYWLFISRMLPPVALNIWAPVDQVLCR